MRRLTHVSPAVKLWSYQVLTMGVRRSSSSNTAAEPSASTQPQVADKNEMNFSKSDFYRYLDILQSKIGSDIKSLESTMSAKFQSLESKMDENIKRVDSRMNSLESGMNKDIQKLESKIDTNKYLLTAGIGALGAMGIFIATLLHQNQSQLKQDQVELKKDLDKRFEKTDQQFEKMNQRFDTLIGLFQLQSTSSHGSTPAPAIHRNLKPTTDASLQMK